MDITVRCAAELFSSWRKAMSEALKEAITKFEVASGDMRRACVALYAQVPEEVAQDVERRYSSLAQAFSELESALSAEGTLMPEVVGTENQGNTSRVPDGREFDSRSGSKSSHAPEGGDVPTLETLISRARILWTEQKRHLADSPIDDAWITDFAASFAHTELSRRAKLPAPEGGDERAKYANSYPLPWKIHRDDVGDEEIVIVPTEIIAANGKKVVAYEGGLAADEKWNQENIEDNARMIIDAVNALTKLPAPEGDDEKDYFNLNAPDAVEGDF